MYGYICVVESHAFKIVTVALWHVTMSYPYYSIGYPCKVLQSAENQVLYKNCIVQNDDDAIVKITFPF